MNTRDAFKKNLPCFDVKVRGNATRDTESFTSKSGTDFEKFGIAHQFGKDGVTSFIHVLTEEGDSGVAAGDYVEVEGQYRESEYTDMNGDLQTNKTIFATSVTVLGRKSENATAKPVPKGNAISKRR